jgi:hypothetical protein
MVGRWDEKTVFLPAALRAARSEMKTAGMLTKYLARTMAGSMAALLVAVWGETSGQTLAAYWAGQRAVWMAALSAIGTAGMRAAPWAASMAVA